MFSYTRANNAHALTYPILKMHWGVLILPNILLAMGPPIIMATILEFISAQSPHSMKGLLIGVFFAIKVLSADQLHCSCSHFFGQYLV